MLKVCVENLGHTTIVHVGGHIVIGPETEVLRKAVLSQTCVSAVVLDLTRVSRIDAHGLGLLLELREQLQSGGLEFHLMNVSKLVQHILKITCLDSVFQIVSEEDARSPDTLEFVLEEA